jgi:hypothetical protein
MKFKSIIVEIVTDLFLLFGIALLLFGIYSIYHPATYITGGLILIVAFKPSFSVNKKNPRRLNRKY